MQAPRTQDKVSKGDTVLPEIVPGLGEYLT